MVSDFQGASSTAFLPMKPKALTLIELLVGMAVTVVISAAVLVNMTLLARKRLEMTGRILAADLVWARQQALTEKQDYWVEFNDTANTYTIYNDSVAPGNVQRRKILDVDLVNITSRTGVQTIQNLAFPVRMRFDADRGTISDTSGNVLALSGIRLGLDNKEVLIGVFGETGGVDFRTYIPSGCFIATAAYHGQRAVTPEPEAAFSDLHILRDFRDRRLCATSGGRFLVRRYYTFSPGIAECIACRPWARGLVRAVLRPAQWCAARITR